VLTVLGILAFAVALLASVTLHEGGHFLTARHYGMKATRFFVGFGPTLYSRQVGETEYGVKAIPLGGFCTIVGMTPLEELDPADEPRAFYRQPWRRRTVVLAAGSFVHFCLAVLITLAGVLLLGVPDDEAPVVTAPVATVPVSAAPGAATVPAPAAGVLRQGDRVVAVDGAPTATWEQVVTAIRAHPAQQVELTIERDGQRLAVPVVPAAVVRPSTTDTGRTERVGAIGVGQQIVLHRVGPVDSLRSTGTLVSGIVTSTWDTVQHRLGSITRVYSKDRDPQGLAGVVGAARVSGEVLGTPQITLGVRLFSLFLLVAGLNFFVGAFNLLPLLPLDGGHIAVVWFETARDRLRRLRGYAGELQRVDYNKLLPLTYTVAAAFLLFTVFIAGADIVNPIKLS
jgi:membrane-associated protease RseP (regulator of RpoE activity)